MNDNYLNMDSTESIIVGLIVGGASVAICLIVTGCCIARHYFKDCDVFPA